ncbi:MAG: four-carbon acid sugar kinase family protein [Actinomycetaceae bacterium]|nr:four-carbon acid sugar kinase family protein [Actinomycetaceae bacterium]
MPLHTREELLAGLPPAPDVSASDVVAAQQASGESPVYVVLDDDPTGTQSVADLPVLTAWQAEDFAWAFDTGAPAVYVMTNSRSLAPDDAARVNREVVTAALQAGAGRQLAFVSRSDSTLRGHFPLEPDTIAECLPEPVDGVVIVPAFGDAGRITVHGTHYAGSPANGYLPVGETEFARDATFGYAASSLPEWVEEKTAGARKAADVIVLDIATLRSDPDATLALLRSARGGQPIAVDIIEEEDLRQLALALIAAEREGSRFIYRVGPPFVRARVGQEVHAPLTPAEVEASRAERVVTTGGLIVVGSHVGLTTRQLDTLRERRSPVELEIDVAKVVQDAPGHVATVAGQAITALAEGNVVVRTSRTLVTGADADESLAISRRVSQAVVDVVRAVVAEVAPRFVIAKGGITSSDVASKGLGLRRATVVGPMLDGIVSLWSGQDGPAAGIPYVVFAGNVGDERSLADVVDKLS